MMTKLRLASVTMLLLSTLCTAVPALAQGRETYIPPARDAVRQVHARSGMVVAQETAAAVIGASFLRQGGNAVDAAVATGFALAVTYPRAGNLGGGGFMVVHLAKDARNIAIDYRETAPAASTKNMFLGADGKPDTAKSRDSALGVGVPGTVAGLVLAYEKYGSGKFTLAQLLQPSIQLARDGFILSDDGADTLPGWHSRLAKWPSSREIFSRADGSSLREGDRLIQRDLALTLERIAEQGARGFYEGDVARLLAASVRAHGGIITEDDLKSYRAIERSPIEGSYRDYKIVAMPLPSSGGIVLLEALNILEGTKLRDHAQGSAPSIHLLIEAMKRAYADRARYLGDPSFTKVPVDMLISKAYASKLREGISADRATRVVIDPPASGPREGSNTTHYSVVDRDGNAVSNTYTLNFSYGLGLVAEGTGVLLNNEMDDFTAAPGASNAYGLVGYEANLPEPGKRPLSSMTPTIVLKDGRVVLVTGSPGGSRIISAVLQVLVNVIDYQLDVAAAVAAPRLHHQWQPDIMRHELGFAPDALDQLRRMGHTLSQSLEQTSANSIAVRSDGLHGAPDPRTRGVNVGLH